PAAFGARTTIGHRTPGLRFRVIRHQPVQLPELPLPVYQQNPENLPGPAVIDHDLDGALRRHILADLIEHAVGIGRMVNHAERVDQVVRLHGDGFAEPFGVRLDEPYAVFQPEDFGALAGEFERLFRQIDGRDPRPGAREVDGVGADAAPDFQHLL